MHAVKHTHTHTHTYTHNIKGYKDILLLVDKPLARGAVYRVAQSKVSHF